MLSRPIKGHPVHRAIRFTACPSLGMSCAGCAGLLSFRTPCDLCRNCYFFGLEKVTKKRANKTMLKHVRLSSFVKLYSFEESSEFGFFCAAAIARRFFSFATAIDSLSNCSRASEKSFNTCVLSIGFSVKSSECSD